MDELADRALTALITLGVAGVIFLARYFVVGPQGVLGRLKALGDGFESLARGFAELRTEEQKERDAALAKMDAMATGLADVNNRLAQGSQTHARITSELDELKKQTSHLTELGRGFGERLILLEEKNGHG